MRYFQNSYIRINKEENWLSKRPILTLFCKEHRDNVYYDLRCTNIIELNSSCRSTFCTIVQMSVREQPLMLNSYVNSGLWRSQNADTKLVTLCHPLTEIQRIFPSCTITLRICDELHMNIQDERSTIKLLVIWAMCCAECKCQDANIFIPSNTSPILIISRSLVSLFIPPPPPRV